MSSNKVKIVGYAQKVTYTDGIEYRNFSPDLVGTQLTSKGGTPLFTMGNFAITTNMEPKSDKSFISTKYSNFISLDNLSLTLIETQSLLDNNAKVILNLDKTNLNYYAMFGSLSEFVRVSLEDIIMKWPASLYMFPISQLPSGPIINGNTYEDYVYDSLTDISTFKINTTYIQNKYELNYLTNGVILDSFSSSNDLRNITVNYESYVVLFNDVEYPVLDFTGCTYTTNDYIYLTIKGNPFDGLPVNNNIKYHIKPNKSFEETFFNSLPDFENYLLSRNIIPTYTSVYKYPIKSDNGIVLYITKKITWPVTDGYNLDFDTSGYIDYASELLDIATKNDLVQSNLMNRFLVSESISAFDTTPVHLSEMDQDTSGQKINKTLQIYGRSFDEITNFISGIAFAHTVSYDKLDNTPDVYLKDLAKVLGWDLISSVGENNLLANYVKTAPAQYSGHTVGLTPVEADIELWRRLILNTPWIWKSKGARKSIEFLLRFIGAPQGLVKFNEYIYKADAPLDMDLFLKVLELNNLDTDLGVYPIDSNGYPRPLPDTENMYFQNNGLWYRQTGGVDASIDILTGNNPHLGPYDGGYKYINQFKNLVLDFSAVTITAETITTGTTNLYTNNQFGTFDQTPINTTITTVELKGINNEDLSECYVVNAKVKPDPYSGITMVNDCGCEYDGVDNIMSLCVQKTNSPGVVTTFAVPQKPVPPCKDIITTPTSDETGLYNFSFYQYNKDGSVFKNDSNVVVPLRTQYASQECCKSLNGTPVLTSESDGRTVFSSGYVCCDKSGNCGCTLACKWIANEESYKVPTRAFNAWYEYGVPAIYTGGYEQSPWTFPEAVVYSNEYIQFTKQDGSQGIVSPDGCNCLADYTVKVPDMVDPYTNEVGVGCKLTAKGIADMLDPVNSVILTTYKARAAGNIKCNAMWYLTWYRRM
jgi:hypothetical protein